VPCSCLRVIFLSIFLRSIIPTRPLLVRFFFFFSEVLLGRNGQAVFCPLPPPARRHLFDFLMNERRVTSFWCGLLGCLKYLFLIPLSSSRLPPPGTKPALSAEMVLFSFLLVVFFFLWFFSPVQVSVFRACLWFRSFCPKVSMSPRPLAANATPVPVLSLPL